MKSLVDTPHNMWSYLCRISHFVWSHWVHTLVVIDSEIVETTTITQLPIGIKRKRGEEKLHLLGLLQKQQRSISQLPPPTIPTPNPKKAKIGEWGEREEEEEEEERERTWSLILRWGFIAKRENDRWRLFFFFFLKFMCGGRRVKRSCHFIGIRHGLVGPTLLTWTQGCALVDPLYGLWARL